MYRDMYSYQARVYRERALALHPSIPTTRVRMRASTRCMPVRAPRGGAHPSIPGKTRFSRHGVAMQRVAVLCVGRATRELAPRAEGSHWDYAVARRRVAPTRTRRGLLLKPYSLPRIRYGGLGGFRIFCICC